MSSIREIVDPSNTLPVVELEPIRTQEWEGLKREKFSIIAEDDHVGECDLIFETGDRDQKAHFDGIEITEGKRGRGIGMATYLLAIERAHSQGLPFETQDYDQTAYSRNIWKKLARLGVAEEVQPFRPSKIREGRYVGKFRVPDPKQ